MVFQTSNSVTQPNSSASTSVYQPPHVQRWLLQAALMQDQSALEAWQKWRNQVDIETLDSNSHHLLSLLYLNLVRHQVDDPHLGRLKGVYRRTWYANQLLMQQFRSVVQALQNSQIETVSLREMALVTTCHPDCGYRPIYQFDLLVRPEQTLAAIDTLQQLGWITHTSKPQPNVGLWHPVTFHNASQFQLNLHNHLFRATPQLYTDGQLWENAIQISDLSTLFLSPVDQLLHLSLKLNHKQSKRPIYWFADAAMMVNAITEESEWIRLVTQAQRYEMILPLRYLLTELQALLETPLPDWVVPSLQKMAISYSELLQYNLLPNHKLLMLKALLVRLRQQWIALSCSNESGR